ncbi:hypothetical protein RDV89_10225 [Nocardioides zeae]|uniref:EccD-like transmembrane domain-containing protein n=1 Tax=Nocardioides imazamoxiresistens TaxID=3231893 RepID=A0ABU3PW99_9ACTN|nr:hypothetical protein [Nocardioides zeae]MDT9593444.1 hypothetical protein [Nocardioides zeae]
MTGTVEPAEALPATSAATGGPGGPASGMLAVSVHGVAGVLDLLVPEGATPADVLKEYARQTGTPPAARLFDGRGREVRADLLLGIAGVTTGSVLVTAPAVPPPVSPAEAAEAARRGAERPTTTASLLVLAGLCALLAGVYATAAAGVDRDVVAGALVAAALLAVLPVGRLVARRAAVAPVFGAAAGLTVAWDDGSARLPMVVGIAGAAAALTAAVGAALGDAGREVLRVWMWAGSAVFVVAGAGAVLGLDERVVWATLLLGAMLAGRVVPSFAVDVPDQALVDFDRLAVSAWSAREGDRKSPRARTIVLRESVEQVVDHGSRTVAAAAAAVLVVTVVAAPLVLTTTHLPLDRIGSPLLVALVGCTQLLVARSYRHATARLLLRVAGLWCLGAVLVLVVAERDWRSQVGIAAFVLGLALVPAAVAVGRGWRSVWWGRRAELAEAFAVAASVPAFVVTVGVFRRIWEITG